MNNPKKPEKRQNNKGLSARQEKALAVLVSGGSCAEAARVAEVAPGTISEWRNDPRFTLEYNKAVNTIRRAALATYQDRIKELVDSSLNTLLSAVKGGDCVAARFVVERAGGLQEAVTEKFRELITPPNLLPEDADIIIHQIADRIMAELAEEEGVTPLQLMAKEEELNKIKTKLITSLEDEFYKRR